VAPIPRALGGKVPKNQVDAGKGEIDRVVGQALKGKKKKRDPVGDVGYSSFCTGKFLGKTSSRPSYKGAIYAARGDPAMGEGDPLRELLGTLRGKDRYNSL